MRRAIERSRRHGEIDPEKDPSALARFMLTMIQGIRGVGKATPERGPGSKTPSTAPWERRSEV